MSRPLTRGQALMLGSVVALALGMAVIGLFAISSRGWYGRDALEIQANFPDVRGVEVGTRVRHRGVDAGEVIAVETGEGGDGEVALRMKLHGKYRKQVKAGSTVRIVNEGMLGGRVLEIVPPKSGEGKPEDHELVADGAVLRGEKAEELQDVVGKLGRIADDIREGKGTLGKLAKDQEVYDRAAALLKSGQEAVEKGRDALTGIQRGADGLKKVPFLGKLLTDARDVLGRTNGEWNRKWYREADLFEPGRATLTTPGQKRLDEEVATWVAGLKHHKGSEVVIVSYADRQAQDASAAVARTQEQADAVANYLKRKHGAHKTGLLPWINTRKVTALGMGTQAPPAPHDQGNRPAPRLEVLVFVPQNN